MMTQPFNPLSSGLSSNSTSATVLISDTDTKTESYESCRSNLSKNVQIPYDDMYKVVLVGAPSVGKTALVQRFCCDNFVLEHYPTLGIDLKVRDIQLSGQRIKLKLWDTSGEDRFRKVVDSYCRGSEAAGVLVVFDVCDSNSFVAAKKWITVLGELASVNLTRAWNPVKILVGNKEDMLAKRVISEASGEQLAIENKFLYIETSAKTGLNVLECFQTLSSRIKHAKEKELCNRRGQLVDSKYGPNCAKRSPSSLTKFEKMNSVIKELELENARTLNSFTTDTESSLPMPDANDDDSCGCIPIRRRRSTTCYIL